MSIARTLVGLVLAIAVGAGAGMLAAPQADAATDHYRCIKPYGVALLQKGDTPRDMLLKVGFAPKVLTWSLDAKPAPGFQYTYTKIRTYRSCSDNHRLVLIHTTQNERWNGHVGPETLVRKSAGSI